MHPVRLKVLSLGFLSAFLLILVKLFYWQILASESLSTLAFNQRDSTSFVPAKRGLILASDGYPLVGNQPTYLMFAYTRDVVEPADSIASALAPIVAPRPEDLLATPSAELAQTLVELTEATLSAKLKNSQSTWIPLADSLLKPQKLAIENLHISGIGFEEHEARLYPESSMSAQLLGFVGSDGTGRPKGYFGLEGHYDRELTGRSGVIQQEKDAFGRPIAIGGYSDIKTRDGRTLVTHLDRSLQMLAENALQDGLEKYGATRGEIIIMSPSTGAILALASAPSYDQSRHRLYDPNLYRLPSITDAYEPGSTFKVLVMAAALNEALITPETICDNPCSGPVKIGRYQIRTWNDQYHPGSTMTEVLENSDNTGMVHLGFLLGKERFVDYIKAFGIGSSTNIDLEAEAVPPLREAWGDIDLAVGSFGQGLAVTSIQMLNAVNAIANDGLLMQPHVVSQVISGEATMTIDPQPVRQVIQKETADTLTTMMVRSAEHGDARWAVPEGYLIAGKTGTAQIPIQGHYDSDKTVASFVGFAPADNPAFSMMVKLEEPTSSPWASETAAPLWFNLAKDLFIHLDIKPQ